ncbi:MAG: serine/threonine protein kinase [Phycisphaerae bacterium]|nr:serine/threonine protein kinase [Phycisphaerae bacterium]
MSFDIPNYRVLGKLGEGAQSRIYLARCMRTGKDYAVKIVKIVRPEDNSFVDLLRAEHLIGSSIDHPVIRKIYELRIMRQRLRVRGAILFMEYVNGMSMSDHAFRRPLLKLLALFRQVAEGLYAMHRAGWVHADLKPENILITPDESVKLIDLGQSSRLGEAKSKIQGTIHYMAPEQAQRGTLDERTDVFGLGAALHRVLTGKPVPTEMNQTVFLHSQSLAGVRLEQVRTPAMDGLPRPVVRFIEDCCHTDPAKRIPNMTKVLERIGLIQAIIERQPATADAASIEELAEKKSTEHADDTLYDTIVDDIGVASENGIDVGEIDEWLEGEERE